jgi:hypothetical protein
MSDFDRTARGVAEQASGYRRYSAGSYPGHLSRAAGRTRCYQDANGNLVEEAAQVGDYKWYTNQERELRESKSGK